MLTVPANIETPTFWSLRHTAVATLLVVCALALTWSLIQLRIVVLLLFGAVVIAMALRPFVLLLAHRLRLGEERAALVVYGAVTIALAVGTVWMLPELIAQTQALLVKLPLWYEALRDFMSESSSRTLNTMSNWLPRELPSAAGEPTASDGTVEPTSLRMTRTVGKVLLGVLATGVLSFYWTVNEPLTIRSLLSVTASHRRDFYRDLIEELLRKVGAYVRGQLVLCGIVGALSLVAFLLIGLPYALLLALVAAIAEAIPVVGPTLGAIPAVIVAASLGPQAVVFTLLTGTVIQTLENYLLVPRVMDRAVGVGAVVTLLSIVAFGAMFGIPGAILAIPMAAILQTLFERLVLHADFKEKPFSVTHRDFTGVMHYQLQDLIHDVRKQQRIKDNQVDEQRGKDFDEIESLAVALDQMVLADAPEARTP